MEEIYKNPIRRLRYKLLNRCARRIFKKIWKLSKGNWYATVYDIDDKTKVRCFVDTWRNDIHYLGTKAKILDEWMNI